MPRPDTAHWGTAACGRSRAIPPETPTAAISYGDRFTTPRLMSMFVRQNVRSMPSSDPLWPDIAFLVMAVRRRVLRVGAVAAGLLCLGVALPAMAIGGDRFGGGKCCPLRVAATDRVTVGGAPLSLTVTVPRGVRRNCGPARAALVVTLARLRADEVRVERALGRRWLPLRLTSARQGAVRATERAVVGLCGRSITYRVRFLTGAPSGRATVAVEAFRPSGGLLGRAATVASVMRPDRRPAPERTAEDRPGRTEPDRPGSEPATRPSEVDSSRAAREPAEVRAGAVPDDGRSDGAGQRREAAGAGSTGETDVAAPTGRRSGAGPGGTGPGAWSAGESGGVRPAEQAPAPPAEQPQASDMEVASPPPADRPRAAGQSRLSAAAVATGLGAVAAVAVTVSIVGGMHIRRRRGPVAASAGPPKAALPALGMPTLPGRWPTQASRIRRTSQGRP
jgi:hypothetical protein